MNYPQNGSSTIFFSIVLVAVLGGLFFAMTQPLFPGAEKGLRGHFPRSK